MTVSRSDKSEQSCFCWEGEIGASRAKCSRRCDGADEAIPLDIPTEGCAAAATRQQQPRQMWALVSHSLAPRCWIACSKQLISDRIPPGNSQIIEKFSLGFGIGRRKTSESIAQWLSDGSLPMQVVPSLAVHRFATPISKPTQFRSGKCDCSIREPLEPPVPPRRMQCSQSLGGEDFANRSRAAVAVCWWRLFWCLGHKVGSGFLLGMARTQGR